MEVIEDSPFGPIKVDRYKPFPGLADPAFDNMGIEDFAAVGSRVTCDPAPTDTDEDYIVLAEYQPLIKTLVDEYGFEKGGSDLVDDSGNEVDPDFYGFASLKLGKLNLIITRDSGFYRRFLAASSVAKRFNLLNKADRVALFQAVLYGNPCEGRTA